MALDSNTVWTGLSGDKLYLNSGEFLTTMITSRSITGVDTTPVGVSWDGQHTPWAGNQADKLYLQSGQFQSTLKTSLGPFAGSVADCSFENGNTPWSDFGSDKLMLASGQFETTLKSSLSISGLDGDPRGITWDGTNTPWSGQVNKKYFLQSGKFSSTLKTSQAAASGTEVLNGMAYTGVNTISTTEDTDKFYSTVGQFTSTILDSYDVTAIESFQTAVAHTALVAPIGCELTAEDFEDTLTSPWSLSGVTLEAGEGYLGTQGAYFNASTDNVRYVLPYALHALYIGFWFMTESTSATVQGLIDFNGASSLVQTSLAIQDSTGDITVRRQTSPTIGTASATNVSDGNWHFIEIYNRVDNVTGAMIVYLDDVKVIDIGPVDTQVTGGSLGIQEIDIDGHAVTSERWIDDFYLDKCEFHGSPAVVSGLNKFVGLSFSYGRSSGGFVA